MVDSETKKASIFNAYAIYVSFVPVENGTQITKLPQQLVIQRFLAFFRHMEFYTSNFG
nr:MAG TPA: hypothetical protein [Caudoviricetes sp.]